MDSKVIGVTGFVLVIFSFLAVVGLFVCQDGIRQCGCIDPESAAWGAFAICALGCVLGWMSVRSKVGLVAGILGVVLLGLFVLQLSMGSSPAPPEQPPKQLESGPEKSAPVSP